MTASGRENGGIMTPLRLPGTTRPTHRQPVLRFACVDSGAFRSLSVTHSDGMNSLNTTGGTWDRGDAAGRQRVLDRLAAFLRGRGVEDARGRVTEYVAEQERESGRPLL
jgi:hypothetical protein